MRPFSQACENNKEPILQVLKSAFAPSTQVLEIGSGTGQHAVHFAAHLSHLRWQPSDQWQDNNDIQSWLDDYSGKNLLPYTVLDVCQETWPEGFDAVFSANTLHIMPWEAGKLMLRRVATLLPENGMFALYGPFKYKGAFTTESNANFDVHLKNNAAHQGIRDFEEVKRILTDNGMVLVRDHALPANNQLLVWKKV